LLVARETVHEKIGLSRRDAVDHSGLDQVHGDIDRNNLACNQSSRESMKKRSGHSANCCRMQAHVHSTAHTALRTLFDVAIYHVSISRTRLDFIAQQISGAQMHPTVLRHNLGALSAFAHSWTAENKHHTHD
jgi:hypothetical protein